MIRIQKLTSGDPRRELILKLTADGDSELMIQERSGANLNEPTEIQRLEIFGIPDRPPPAALPFVATIKARTPFDWIVVKHPEPQGPAKAASPVQERTGRDGVFDKVVEFIREEFGDEVDTANITNETQFSALEGYDSLNIINVMISLEEKFDIHMLDEDIEKIATVGQAVDYVMEHKAPEFATV